MCGSNFYESDVTSSADLFLNIKSHLKSKYVAATRPWDTQTSQLHRFE